VLRACRRLALWSALASMAFAAACTPTKVESSANPDWSPAGATAYAWRPRPGGHLGDPRVDEEHVVKTMRASADAVLAAKGYRLVPSDDADFLLGYWLVAGEYDVGSPKDGSRKRASGDRPPGYWEDVLNIPPNHVEKGTIGLYVVDGEPPRDVWRGYARKVMDFKASRSERAERVAEAVRRILKDFPTAGGDS